MPWLPEFGEALRLAHATTPSPGLPARVPDPVDATLAALDRAGRDGPDPTPPLPVVVHDPGHGRVSGPAELGRYLADSAGWRERRRARTELTASTAAGGRAVVELLTTLALDGRAVALPVAVVAECPPDGASVEFRVYHSHWPLTGGHRPRPPILEPGDQHPADVVGRYHAALGAGDAEAIVSLFEPDGYFREPAGPDHTYRGTAELRRLYTSFLGAGGIGLEHCTVTDDGTRCALEFNAVRWGTVELPRQAGVAVYERGRSGLLAAARVYDDVDPPALTT